MSDNVKQVKVDNWGIYFLQRLKHFFNRTDYCDLTLQFQDNAQLKVHRLVLSACTEYFELLERTCEMYEDCLVMPDDLQADVVVPIVNFMYTGQLEFRLELLESLYQTSQIMNMPVLTKLLEAHRHQNLAIKPVLNHSAPKRSYSKTADNRQKVSSVTNNTSNKRSYGKAFPNVTSMPSKERKVIPSMPSRKFEETIGVNNGTSHFQPVLSTSSSLRNISKKLGEPRPTRYELPEELDRDNIFDNSFTSISYTSQPLMVHPDTTKRYPAKRHPLFGEASSSKKFGDTSTVDIVECKKINRRDNIFEDDDVNERIPDETDMFPAAQINIKQEMPKVSNQLFDQILDEHVIPGGPKVTIETKDNQQVSNVDHAKIISEVLKKYPHLVKSNKNIKLKILNTPTTTKPKPRKQTASPLEKVKTDPDFSYETDVLDSMEAARLIALGAENIKGPWICLICGTPGRALHFTSYYKFRRHLVEVHNEKPVSKICEYCGLKSLKRNYLLHHLYTKHGVEPPPSYNFPKCNQCSYVALTEGFLIKHKLSHTEGRNFRCNVCAYSFGSSNQLLAHIQNTGHKYTAERKANLQCIYCLKVFSLEGNLYAHIKTNHRHEATNDGVIEDSDEDRPPTLNQSSANLNTSQNPDANPSTLVKYEPPSYEYEGMEGQYQIQQRPDGNIQLISTKTPTKQKILNSGFHAPVTKQLKPKPMEKLPSNSFEYQNVSIASNKQNKELEEIVVIDNNEYIVRDNQFIPRKKVASNNDYIISDLTPDRNHDLTSASMEFSDISEEMPEHKMIMKKSANMNQPIQIVVSNEEEYKALMGSNHSIIFSDGEANKTLTVLSTPHSTLNATTIDLDNPQSSDMMIIPDNYPLSEAVPTDNSNIVVVYSHPVNDPSKQFQLITSQDIGAQFVQSSAVITQNFGTITTSTPVMDAHVMDTQVGGSWQNNMQGDTQQQADITQSNELQEMAVIQQTEIAVAENEAINDMNELPEVTLTTETPRETISNKKEVEEYLTQTAVIADVVETDRNDQIIEGNMQSISSVSLEDSNVLTIAAIQDVDDRNQELTIDNEAQNCVNLPVESEEQPVDETTVVEAMEVDTHAEVIEAESSEVTVDDTQNDDNGNIKEANDTHEPDTIVQITSNSNEVVPTEITPPDGQIQTLASEWSEEEDEVGVQETNNQESCGVDNSVENNPTTETSVVIEESVVHQIDADVPQKPDTQVDSEESVVSSGENVQLMHEEAIPHTTVGGSQDKISSLLNEWEDNDSQGEDDSANGNDGNEATVTIKEVEIDEQKQPKTDKISSLVSDWDEEDEENKN